MRSSTSRMGVGSDGRSPRESAWGRAAKLEHSSAGRTAEVYDAAHTDSVARSGWAYPSFMRTLIAFFLVAAACGCSGGKGGNGDNTEEDGASLDGTFGTGGVASVPVTVAGSTASAYGMALHSDGSVVIAGQGNEVTANFEATAARFAANGTADPLFPVFASGGTALDIAQAVAIQADGAIVLAGRADLEGMLARF